MSGACLTPLCLCARRFETKIVLSDGELKKLFAYEFDRHFAYELSFLSLRLMLLLTYIENRYRDLKS